MLGSEVFNVLYAGLPDARCTVQAGEYVAARCLCPSLGQTAGSSEQGLYASADINVRLLLADDAPNDGFGFGRRVTVTTVNGSVYQLRVAGRVPSSDVLRLMLEGVAE
jgi:hypothetical protein